MSTGCRCGVTIPSATRPGTSRVSSPPGPVDGSSAISWTVTTAGARSCWVGSAGAPRRTHASRSRWAFATVCARPCFSPQPTVHPRAGDLGNGFPRARRLPINRRKVRMPHEVHDRRVVREMMEKGAQVVEVLPREEYEEDHLPGAINLPLRRIETEARQRLEASLGKRVAPNGASADRRPGGRRRSRAGCPGRLPARCDDRHRGPDRPTLAVSTWAAFAVQALLESRSYG
jgi:Rhodanese-like domain